MFPGIINTEWVDATGHERGFIQCASCDFVASTVVSTRTKERLSRREIWVEERLAEYIDDHNTAAHRL